VKTRFKLLAGTIISAVTLAAQIPTITGVVNAGNQLPAGLPNSGIAQGALFDIYGTNLSAAPNQGSPFTEASLPLPTTSGLAGTTVTIAVNGTTVNAPILFTTQTQIGAVMPSNTPLGIGTLSVFYNGNGTTAPVTVVQTGFGISFNYIQYANNGIGMGGQAAVTFVNQPTQAATTTHIAKAGDQMTIWGTGLGATTSAGDNGGAPFGLIGSAPLVFVGGVQAAAVSYWGRSPGSVALDQINFTIPAAAPSGCNVSVVVETMNGTTPVVSNGPTISIGSTDGATCSDSISPFPLSLLSQTSANIIEIALNQQVTTTAGATPTTTTKTGATGTLFSLNQAQITATGAGSLHAADYQPSLGSCYSGFNQNPGAIGPSLGTPVNGGTSITLTPPSGSPISLTSTSTGTYTSTAGTTSLPSGTYSVSNGAAVSGVNPISFNFSVPQQVTWTNESTVSGSTVMRSNGLSISWTGGDVNGYVDIRGQAAAGSYQVGFECTAPASAGQFTVPASIMLGMPAAAGNITVSTDAIPSSLGVLAGYYLAEDGSTFSTTVPVTFN
jgi:uncharacterized protein (TIGR03437 family)